MPSRRVLPTVRAPTRPPTTSRPTTSRLISFRLTSVRRTTSRVAFSRFAGSLCVLVGEVVLRQHRCRAGRGHGDGRGRGEAGACLPLAGHGELRRVAFVQGRRVVGGLTAAATQGTDSDCDLRGAEPGFSRGQARVPVLGDATPRGDLTRAGGGGPWCGRGSRGR